MSDEVLVVGATGHVGSQVARLLAESGRPVRAFVRSAGSTIHGADDLPISYVVGDLRDPDSVDAAVRGVGVVVSTANGIIPSGRTASPKQMNELTGDVLVAAAERAFDFRAVPERFSDGLARQTATTAEPSHPTRDTGQV